MEFDVVILGAGAAGMMAAVAAGEGLAGSGRRIAIFEKNERAGIKVLVCGGGRCNFTNAGTVDFLIGQFGRMGRFLSPALRHLDNEGLRDFFAGLGVPSHVEHDGKVYPDSNQAKSVVDALLRRMRELGVEVFVGQAVGKVERAEEGFVVTTGAGAVYATKVVVLAMGGMSYQRMGTVGEGYTVAEGLGHSVVTPRPAIVGLIVKEEWGKELQGLAVRDVEVVVELPRGGAGKRVGAMMENRRSVNDVLFTHFGLSGPAVLNPSEIVAELLETSETVNVRVDFARHVTHDGAHALLRAWQQREGKKLVRKMLALGQPAEVKLVRGTSPDQMWAPPPEGAVARGGAGGMSLPVRLAEMVCTLEGIDREQICAALTSAQMHRVVQRIKQSVFTVTATRGFKEAMVTAGGVRLSEVDPATMESKVTRNLFLTGEVLDLTGPSGGYNLQLAFSTGHLAGVEVARRVLGD